MPRHIRTHQPGRTVIAVVHTRRVRITGRANRTVERFVVDPTRRRASDPIRRDCGGSGAGPDHAGQPTPRVITVRHAVAVAGVPRPRRIRHPRDHPRQTVICRRRDRLTIQRRRRRPPRRVIRLAQRPVPGDCTPGRAVVEAGGSVADARPAMTATTSPMTANQTNNTPEFARRRPVIPRPLLQSFQIGPQTYTALTNRQTVGAIAEPTVASNTVR
jgi:hypothetical protein